MDDLAANRVALHLAGNGKYFFVAFDFDVDECVAAGLGMQRGIELTTVDGN